MHAKDYLGKAKWNVSFGLLFFCWEAYYRGIPAKGPTQPKPIGTQVTGGNLVVTLYSPRTVTGVTASSSTTPNLGTWSDGPVPVLSGTTPTRNIYQVTIPISAVPNFVRFNIIRE